MNGISGDEKSRRGGGQKKRLQVPKTNTGNRKGKMTRINTFPAALNRKQADPRWDESVDNFAQRIRELRVAAQNLVTLNIEPNTSKLCPHKYSCVQNCFYKGLFRSFAAGYLFKSLLAFFSALLRGKLGKKHHTLEDIFRGKDALQFGQFVGIMSFVYKAVLCSLRRYFRSNSPKYHAIAGFVAGSAIVFDDPSRRSSIALYCIVRAIADLLANLKASKKLPPVPHGDAIVFTLSQVPIIYSFVKCPQLMSRGYYKWIQKMGDVTSEGLRRSTRSRISDSMHRLPGEKWEPCEYHAHEPSCAAYNAKDWFRGLGRAIPIYLPVHILPTLLFTPGKIVKNPKRFVKQKLENILRSAVFLTTYQFNTKSTQCFLRNLIHDDPSWISVAAGLSSGTSIFLEHPKRRTELTLYVLPRALEVCANYIIRFHSSSDGMIQKSVPLLSLLGFQTSLAIWMGIQAVPEFTEMNGLNRSGLRAVFGSKH